MAHNYEIRMESEMNPADMGVVIAGLTAFNASKADGDVPNYLFLTVRDDAGRIAGGLVGASYLGWMQVQAVWIEEALRGLGYGNAMMQQVEEEALRRGCPRLFLETLSFQALSFYEKRGYAIFSRLDGFPPGGARYALTKQLATA